MLDARNLAHHGGIVTILPDVDLMTLAEYLTAKVEGFCPANCGDLSAIVQTVVVDTALVILGDVSIEEFKPG